MPSSAHDAHWWSAEQVDVEQAEERDAERDGDHDDEKR